MTVGRIICALGSAALLTVPSPRVAFAASPPPLDVYGQLPKTEAVELSADGTMAAQVVTIDDTRVLVISKDDGRLLTRAGMGDLKLSGLEWAGNDYVVVYFHQ